MATENPESEGQTSSEAQAESDPPAADAAAEVAPPAETSEGASPPQPAAAEPPDAPATPSSEVVTQEAPSDAADAATAAETGTASDHAAAAAPSDAPGGDTPSEGSETGSADATAPIAPDAESIPPEAGADAAPDKKKKRRRRRKKKPGKESERPESRPAHRAPERAPFHVGEEVFGKVTAVLETAIMVDLSGKALAIFDRGEMETDDLVPSPGDRFVARVHNDGGRGGLVVLTRKPLREEEIRPVVEAAAKSGELIEGLVTGVIKGGVEVDISGLRAFAPASGLDLHPANANFAGLVGQRMEFKVVQFEKAGRDVVVSRRPMLEKEAHERRKKALALLEEGAEMQGIVRTVVEWGAFVALPDAENLEGLVHISEVSHDPRVKIADTLKPGDKFPVKITKIDDKGKIWLSRKALIEDPWGEAKQKYTPGSQHQGKVTRVEKFGAFVQLDDEVDGLIHINDISFKRIEHPEEVVKVGDEVSVVVRHFDFRNRKIALHPALTAEQADEPRQKVSRNAHVEAEVIRGDSAGVHVRVLGVTGREARGFIPAGQTGTQRGTDLRKHFKPGQRLSLKVLDLDPRRGEPKLSLRGRKEDEERKAHREYRQQFKAEAKFGTLGDLLKAKLNLSEESGKEESGK